MMEENHTEQGPIRLPENWEEESDLGIDRLDEALGLAADESAAKKSPKSNWVLGKRLKQAGH